MDLKTYYQELTEAPINTKKGLRQEICKICNTSERNAYRILKGETEPTPLEKKAIAKRLSRKVEELFPEKK